MSLATRNMSVANGNMIFSKQEGTHADLLVKALLAAVHPETKEIRNEVPSQAEELLDRGSTKACEGAEDCALDLGHLSILHRVDKSVLGLGGVVL